MLKQLIKHLVKSYKTTIRTLLDTNNMSLHGIKLDLQHPNISKELKIFFYNGSYEAAEIEILKRFLDTDDTVMEIGAGIGFLSAYCAKVVGSKRVFAYEANPFMIDKINQIYEMNNVCPEINNVFLSNKIGTESFYLERNFWSSSSIKRSKDSQKVEVDSVDINQEIDEKKPSLLIIDVEGGERDLLTIINFKTNSIRKILIELHPHVIGAQTVSNLIHHLISESFIINLVESRGIVLVFEKANS